MPTDPCHYVKLMYGIFDLHKELPNYYEKKSDYSSKLSRYLFIYLFVPWGRLLFNSSLMHKDLIFIFPFSEELTDLVL